MEVGKIERIEVVTYFQKLLARVKYEGKDELVEYSGTNSVNMAIDSFVKESGKKVQELFFERLISVDEKAWAKFDYTHEKGFTEKPLVSSVRKPIVEEVSELVNFEEIVRELIKLNPTAEITFSDSTSGIYEISSTIPGDRLVLPKGFEYNDKNGITNKHHTTTGSYICINVKELEKAIPPIASEGAPVVEEAVVDESHTIAEDGAIDLSEAEVKETKKKKKGIKNLKTKVIATLVAAGILTTGGYILSGGLNNVVKNNTSHTDDTYTVEMQDGTYEYSYDDNVDYDLEEGYYIEPLPEEERRTYPYEKYGSAVYYDSMEKQIQAINDMCFAYTTNAIENIVIAPDYDAIQIINNLRNKVVTYREDASLFLNNIVNYIFENGNNFNGYNIKPYQALSPFAQYIVLVSGQSILQLNTGYTHQTQLNYYDFDILTTSFDYMVDSTYRVLNDISPMSK